MDNLFYLTNQNTSEIAGLKVELEHYKEKVSLMEQDNAVRDEKISDCSTYIFKLLEILNRLVLTSNSQNDFSLQDAINSLEKVANKD